jgi:hypothetical protein
MYTISNSLTFGKYTGRTIENIWTGKIEGNQETIVREYLQDFLNSFDGTPSESKMVVSSGSDLDFVETSIKFIELNKIFLKIYVAKHHLIICNTPDEYLDSVKKVIHGLLEGSYKNPMKGAFKSNGGSEFSEQSKRLITLIADPNYISKALEEIPEFFILPSDIDYLENMPCRKFSGFLLTDLSEDVIAYEPKFIDFPFSLSSSIKDKNFEKYQNMKNDDNENYSYKRERFNNRDAFDTDEQYNDWLNN